MKKIISILSTITLLFTIAVTPALAYDNITTGSGVNVKQNNSDKAVKNLESQLKKAENQLKKLIDDQAKLEVTIKKAIDKARASDLKKNDSAEKKIEDANSLIAKWEAELNKAAEHDKLELANLNNDIAKWTEMTEKQKSALNQQISNIDITLTKQLAELDKKIVAAKDDATKQNLANAKVSAQKYAADRKTAINNYLASLQTIFADRQKVWAERKDLLMRRQASDAAFRTAMFNIKKAELNDKLSSLYNVKSTPVETIESTVRAKYQKQVDTIKTNIAKTNALIIDLKAKLNK